MAERYFQFGLITTTFNIGSSILAIATTVLFSASQTQILTGLGGDMSLKPIGE